MQSDSVVLIPGLGAFHGLLSRRRPSTEPFAGLTDYLTQRGVRVAVARLDPTASVARRAAQLVTFVRDTFDQAPIRLVGHSLGGLDARFAVGRLGLHTQTRSITTIGTPHRGTPVADWWLARAAGASLRLFGTGGAIADLTPWACERFNEVVPNVPGVPIRSIAGACPAEWLGLEWRLPGRLVERLEGAHDGVVSVASATWGERTDVWTADHLNLVNWPNRRMCRAGSWTDRAADLGRVVLAD